MLEMNRRAPAAVLLAVALSACGGILPSKLASNDVRVRDVTKDANRCVVAATHREPLVTEWTASSKARLEVLLTTTLEDTDKTAVAVEYSGCELRIVDECQPLAAYTWSRSTLSRDTVEINDADDLYAKLPLGAVSLEGALKRSGHLSIMTTVAGQIQLNRSSIDFDAVAAEPTCATATHIIQAVSIGAFKMVEGGKGHASAGVGVTGVGHAGASTSRAEQLMRESGSDADCKQTTQGEPHPGCRSPLQLFLLPIPNRAEKVNLNQLGTLLPESPAGGKHTPNPSNKGSKLRTLSYVLGGLGIAGLGGGGASVVVSGSMEDKIRNGTYSTSEDILNAQNSMATMRTLGSAGLISGGVLLGLAVPFFILGGK